MDVLAAKLQSTKFLFAAFIFTTATALLYFSLLPAAVWESVAQTCLLGYALADVAQKWAPK